MSRNRSNQKWRAAATVGEFSQARNDTEHHAPDCACRRCRRLRWSAAARIAKKKRTTDPQPGETP